MDEDAEPGTDEELTYAATGVDIEASDAATAALVGAGASLGEQTGDPDLSGYAGLVDIGDRYLGLATDGVGTKLLVAEAIEEYSTVGIDCVAMNANDMVAQGVEPVAFVDYLAVDAPDEDCAQQLGEGLQRGCNRAGLSLVGGEFAVLPEVLTGFDLAGTCAGLAPKDAIIPGDASAGDALVGFASSGIHSNGLTLAREAVTRNHDYEDPFPHDNSKTIGEVLLEPTKLYTGLLDALRAHDVHAAAHITGGGWENLGRLGAFHYSITDPLDAQPIFEFVQTEGNVSDAEMHRTFNMGTGFVVALPDAEAGSLVEATDGARIGTVETGQRVSIRGLELSLSE